MTPIQSLLIVNLICTDMFKTMFSTFAIDKNIDLPVHLQSDQSVPFYTEQKKKRKNYIPLNFEQTMIQSEIIGFSTSALDISLLNARNRFSF